MALNQKRFDHSHETVLRDIRPLGVRIADYISRPAVAMTIFCILAISIYTSLVVQFVADLVFLTGCGFFWWLTRVDRQLAFRMPAYSRWKDKSARGGTPAGIMYMGNTKRTGEQAWFTANDAKTHVLYLGTTGSGKTEGLKSIVANSLAWGSGFIYIDGKADTDLWSSLSSLVRRFGREDDLLVLNYMTGNSDVHAPSNTMNPFSGGSASYLANMMVSLMPAAEGDNAMWKERAVALLSSLMPALTWKRDNQDLPLSVSRIRKFLELPEIIKLSRDEALPEKIRDGLRGYLNTLPGYIDAVFDDEGNEKPPGPDVPMTDTQVPRQQHGYLSMQFTRSLQSLGDEYGYIFDADAADIDMVDLVLNRRILIALIPALEKSGDDAANLGKIVAAALKGMMGSTLGADVEGDSTKVIENKPTHSRTPFVTVFDEVGYYAAEGMGVMAAQARSLGFCLVFAAQDLPGMEKRVKEEARSITANCNLKIFGKLEDPDQTKDFFSKTVGEAIVTEVSGYSMTPGSLTDSYYGSEQLSVQLRPRASYDGLKAFKEGEAVFAFGDHVFDINVFYANPGNAKAMRVQRMLGVPPVDETILRNTRSLQTLRDNLVNKNWTARAEKAEPELAEPLRVIADSFSEYRRGGREFVDCAALSVAAVRALSASPEDLAPARTKQEPVKAEAQSPAETARAPATAAGNGRGGGGGGGGSGNPLSFFAPGAGRAGDTSAHGETSGQEGEGGSGAPANPLSFFAPGSAPPETPADAQETGNTPETPAVTEDTAEPGSSETRTPDQNSDSDTGDQGLGPGNPLSMFARPGNQSPESTGDADDTEQASEEARPEENGNDPEGADPGGAETDAAHHDKHHDSPDLFGHTDRNHSDGNGSDRTE